MPSKEELKKEEEKRKKETEVVAQQYVVDNLVANNFNADGYVPSFLMNYDIQEAEKPADEIESEPEVIDAEVEETNKEESAPAEKPEMSAFANTRFQEFLQKDIEESNKAIEEIKKRHPKDYDKYIESLKKTDYYQERLKYWREYYAKKREELSTEEAALDEHARNEAMRTLSEEEAEKKPAVVLQPTSNGNKAVLGDGNYETSLSMKADPALKNTIEQILLNDLYNSLDKYRSYYKSGKAVPNTSGVSSKMKEAMNKINSTRTEFIVELFGSFSEVFNTADGKRIFEPYTKTIKAMQKRINSKQGDLTMTDIADVVMDRFYHVENGKISGIIPKLAEELTIQVQKELINRGQFNFNLCQKAAKEILSNIATDSKLVSNIVRDKESSLLYLNEIKNIDKFYQSIINDIKAGKFETNLEYIDGYSEYLRRMAEQYTEQEYVMYELSRSVDTLNVLAINAKKLMESDNSETQLKDVLSSLERERRNLKSIKDVNHLFEEKSFDNFAKTNKDTNTQALTDKLTMDVLKIVGAYNSLNQLNKFEFTSEQCDHETEKLLEYAKANENISVNVDLAMLFNIGTIVSDIREKFSYASDNPNKLRNIDNEGNIKVKNVAYGENIKDIVRYKDIADKAQNLLENELKQAVDILSIKEKTDDLSKEEQEIINNAFNSFIALSKETRKSERRKEVGLEKSL